MSSKTSPSSTKNKILFQVGARLEAMDYTLSWYSAKICRVDQKERKVLIHFEGWNHRYDEWISFDSERLRPHGRQHLFQESKDEKEVCDYQDWKTGDRVLAKWQDCKFYPAKITKCLSEGAYEVHFYDGFKKVVHRVNIKPDTRKSTMMPVDKFEHDKEVQERKERRQQMASARAERARKRSAEISPTPAIPVKRKDNRGRKGRVQERDDFGTASESSVSSPAETPEVEEILVDSQRMEMEQKQAEAEINKGDGQPSDSKSDNTDQQEIEESVESSFTQVKEAKTPVGTITQEKMLEEKIIIPTTPVEKITEQKILKAQETEQKVPVEEIAELESQVEIIKHEEDKEELDIKTANREENELSSQKPSPSLQLCQAHEEESIQTLVKEESEENTLSNVDSQESRNESIKLEETNSNSGKGVLKIETESTETEQGKHVSKIEDESRIACDDDDEDDNDNDEVLLIKLEPQTSSPTMAENEINNDGSVCDSISSEVLQEQSDPSQVTLLAPKTETKTSPVASKPVDSHKIKISKGPKIKRTLSKAERLSRARKAKSALSLKTGASLKGSPLGFKGSPKAKQQEIPGVSMPTKADTPGVSLPLIGTPGVSLSSKGATPVKASVKNEKTVQRRRSFKGGRPSSISPRGYGYSMAFMDIEKPAVSAVKTEEESIEVPTTVTESGLGLLKISTQITTCTSTSPTSPTTTVTPTENQAAPKKQTYQAKKFRLDQITGKLSAQRQSEAQAAAHTPSAFQLTKHHSSPPPPPALSPSPPANPPFPRESYPPPGPPPLLYSPMAGSCCPTPHHPHMYGPHPGHGMHLPAGHMHPHPEYPPPSSGYMLYAHGMHYPPHGPCMGQCSCSAGVRQPVFHPLPPGAPPRPPTHESALAQLMQCEQRILHGGPGMPHYREAAPPGPWVGHRHGPPPSQPFIPVGHHHEDRWHAHEERTLQAPPVSQAPPPPSSISPTSDSGKLANRRSRKSERPLPTKTLPGSTIPGTETPLTSTASKTDKESTSTVNKGVTQRSDGDHVDVTSKPAVSETGAKDGLKENPEKDQRPLATTSQMPAVSDQKEVPVLPISSASVVGAVSANTVPSMGGISGLQLGGSPDGFPPLLPGRMRKSKELAPKELVIEIDHNKYKCQIPGCDKSFRKQSGLEYHIKYYHDQKDKAGMKRKKSVSVRCDSTPETSPEFGGHHRVPKRRIHRSSAPGQLTTPSTSQLSSLPPVAFPPATSTTAEPSPLASECSSDVFTSISMDSEPSVSQDTDLEIDTGSVDMESIDPGMVECMEVEEEEDINGDVIRCLCNEIEEGGFMIQCEQCLTWQHSECVGLSELTVPPNYICYVCAKPRGLRKSAKYKNDFDWFRRGTLACMPFTSLAEPEYTAELNLATHGLMSDVHDVNRCLRSLKLKFELLRNPSRPDLKCWQGPRKRDTSENKTSESTTQSTTGTHDSVKHAPEQEETSKTVCTKNEGHAVINGHAEVEGPAQNGVTGVKQERPSTLPPRKDGPGDTNNNIQDNKAPVLNTGSTSLMSSGSTGSGPGYNVSSNETSKDTLSEAKPEEEPLSPIPALVPAYMKSAPPSDQGKTEKVSNAKSDNSQIAVKSESDREGSGQPVQLSSSVGSCRVDSSQVKAPHSEGTPQLGADSRVKRESQGTSQLGADSSVKKEDQGTPKLGADLPVKKENQDTSQLGADSRVKKESQSAVSSQSTSVTATSDVKVESQESPQSMSDDESVGAINNLLDDITEIQDDLESRMDEIEQQLTVLEEAYGTPTQTAKKTDFRKLVKDLSRVRRLLQQVS